MKPCIGHLKLRPSEKLKGNRPYLRRLKLKSRIFILNRFFSSDVAHGAMNSDLTALSYIPLLASRHQNEWAHAQLVASKRDTRVRPQCSVCLKTFSRQGALKVS